MKVENIKLAICGGLSAIMLFSSLGINSFAADTDSVSITEETTSVGTGEEEGEEVVPIGVSNEIIYHTQTTRTNATPCQITANFTIPAGFGLDAYVQFTNAETGEMYQITTTDENGYVDYAFVPSGEYRIYTYGIVEDRTYQYPFVMTSEDIFYVDEDNGGFFVIDLEIENYDEIEAVIAERSKVTVEPVVAEEEVVEEPVIETKEFGNSTAYKTYFDEIWSSGNFLFYETTTNSKHATMYASGNALDDYDVVIEITEPGVLGEAKFSVSLDGGATILGEDYTSEEYNLEGTGLMLFFAMDDDVSELEVGDKFEFKAPKTFLVNGAKGDANVIVQGNPQESTSFSVTVFHAGERGVGKFNLVEGDNTDNKIVETIPEDGVYEFGDFTLYFADAYFEKDAYFSLSYKFKTDEVNYTPLYFVIAGVIVLVIIMYFFLSSKKEKSKDYKLNVWNSRQSEDKYE